MQQRKKSRRRQLLEHKYDVEIAKAECVVKHAFRFFVVGSDIVHNTELSREHPFKKDLTDGTTNLYV